MLLVSEHGTGFGLLPLMLVLMGLPAFGALTLAGHIGRALRSWFDPRPTSRRQPVRSVWNCPRPMHPEHALAR
jgi:hypothetical protein